MIQAKMADMYTTLNSCRAYLYTTAKAVDNGYVSAKVSFFKQNSFVIMNLNLTNIVVGLCRCNPSFGRESYSGST